MDEIQEFFNLRLCFMEYDFGKCLNRLFKSFTFKELLKN